MTRREKRLRHIGNAKFKSAIHSSVIGFSSSSCSSSGSYYISHTATTGASHVWQFPSGAEQLDSVAEGHADSPTLLAGYTGESGQWDYCK